MNDIIQEKIKMTAKDFFLHIASIVALYASAIALLTLLFRAIDAAFPDQLYANYDYYSSGIRFAIATAIIVFPLFLTLSYVLNKDYAKNPEKRELGVRKWLTFLTLFVAGAVIVGDVITLLYNFLGGEITSRFGSKVLSVLVVAGLIFWYYLYDLRRKEPGGNRKHFAVAGAAVVLVSLVWGFSVMGSPATQRKLRLDDTRVQHLQTIQSEIVGYWQLKRTLPATLDELPNSISGFTLPKDPDTDASYEYALVKKGNPSFSLCATFSLPSVSGRTGAYYSMPLSENENWQHKAGRQCFERTIDPELYPVNQNVLPVPKRIY
ncbi:MAG TPA: DUF5671 domain-containing protein [Candidatus Paceibacterota bacterium]